MPSQPYLGTLDFVALALGVLASGALASGALALDTLRRA